LGVVMVVVAAMKLGILAAINMVIAAAWFCF
jgi:hypothetical protein